MRKLILFVAIFSQLSAFSHTKHDGEKSTIPHARIFGKITDADGKGIAHVSVIIIKEDEKTSTKPNSTAIVKGVTTKDNGQFDVKDLPASGKFSIKISGIGYEPQEQIVSFNDSKLQASPVAEKNLGNIVLKSSIMELQGVSFSR